MVYKIRYFPVPDCPHKHTQCKKILSTYVFMPHTWSSLYLETKGFFRCSHKKVENNFILFQKIVQILGKSSAIILVEAHWYAYDTFRVWQKLNKLSIFKLFNLGMCHYSCGITQTDSPWVNTRWRWRWK